MKLLSTAFVLLFALNFSACKKVEEPEPDSCEKFSEIADEVAELDVSTVAGCKKFKTLFAEALKYAKKCDLLDQEEVEALEDTQEDVEAIDCNSFASAASPLMNKMEEKIKELNTRKNDEIF